MIVGAFTTLVITLVLFGVDVSQLVLGGAITTIFLSIAAQPCLAATVRLHLRRIPHVQRVMHIPMRQDG